LECQKCHSALTSEVDVSADYVPIVVNPGVKTDAPAATAEAAAQSMPQDNSQAAEREHFEPARTLKETLPEMPEPTLPPVPDKTSATIRNDVPAATGDGFTGTINPWGAIQTEMPAGECAFKLIPLRQGMDPEDAPVPQRYEGERVSLNRDNLDKGNPTITSQTQAVIFHRNGQWMIEDHSGQRSTFVRIDGAMQLKDGDVILMGNRLYRFENDTKATPTD